jgi:hypothetical protein
MAETPDSESPAIAVAVLFTLGVVLPIVSNEIGSKDAWPGKLTPTEMRVCELFTVAGLICLLGSFVLGGRLLLRWHRRRRGAQTRDTQPPDGSAAAGDSEGREQ